MATSDARRRAARRSDRATGGRALSELGPVVLIGAGGFAAAAVVTLLVADLPVGGRRLVPVAAVAFALAGAAATPAATGTAPLDALLRAGLCAGAVLAGAWADPRVLVVAAALALGAAGGPAAGAAAAALGAAVVLAAGRTDAPLPAAVSAGLTAEAGLRLTRPGVERGTAAVAVVVFALVVAAGMTRLPPARRRSATRAASAVGGAAAVAVLLGLTAATLARPDLERAIGQATAGLRAARRGDGPVAARLLGRAAGSFSRADRRLGSWWARPATVVPVVAPNARALHAMAASGGALSGVGSRAAVVADAGRLRLAGGAVPVAPVVALRGPARDASSALASTEARLARARSPWLLPEVSDPLDLLARRARRARTEVHAAMVASDLVPALLGGDGPRRYFLAVQTPAELRGSGGFIGSFGEISADRGRLSLDRVGRTADLNQGGDARARRLLAPPDYSSRYARFDVDLLWQNVTMSPDFPTVARAIAGLYPQSGGRPVDGVVAIDPIGLAALLRVTGPVQVEGWPVPLTGANAARVLLFEQYVRLDGPARVDFLGRVTEAVWRRLTSTSAGVDELGRALGPMVAQKHLQVASTHPEEEEALRRLGVAGEMAPVRGDFLGIVTQNAGANKIDWFLRRAVTYGARVDPASGALHATVRVTLHNLAPATGLPGYVIGSGTSPPLPPGSNKLYLSVYTPWLLSAARLDGGPWLLESEIERARHVYSTFLTIAPGGSSTVELELTGRLPAGDGYRLDLHRQPFLAPDEVTASVRLGDRRPVVERVRLLADRRVLRTR